jgi:hypothetical protein
LPRSYAIMVFSLLLFSGSSFSSGESEIWDPTSGFKPDESVHFIPNKGQMKRDDILFYTRDPVTMGFTNHSAITVLTDRENRSLSFEAIFVECNEVEPVGMGEFTMVYNYLVGDESCWRRGIHPYSSIRYPDLWDGIDLVYRSVEGSIKYEFIVKPGADPERILIEYRGMTGMFIGSNGNLIVKTILGCVEDSELVSFQEGREIQLNFHIDCNRVSFQMEKYDDKKTLIIDPHIVCSTYLSGSDSDEIEGGMRLYDGYPYLAGNTRSSDFPVTVGIIDTLLSDTDAFITKMTSDLSNLEFSTFLGGSDYEEIEAFNFDDRGNIIVGGMTSSKDFPTTSGVLNETSNIWTDPRNVSMPTDDVTYADAFFSKINQNGTKLLFSTFIGGHDSECVKDIEIVFILLDMPFPEISRRKMHFNPTIQVEVNTSF